MGSPGWCGERRLSSPLPWLWRDSGGHAGSCTQPGSGPAVRALHTWTPLPTVGSQHKCPIPSTLPRGEPGSSITCSFSPSMTPREDTCSYLWLLSSFTARIYRTVCDQPTVIASFFMDMGIQLEMYKHTHPISHSKDNGSELKCLWNLSLQWKEPGEWSCVLVIRWGVCQPNRIQLWRLLFGLQCWRKKLLFASIFKWRNFT